MTATTTQDTPRIAASEGQALNKRKAEVIEVHDSDSEDEAKRPKADAAPTEVVSCEVSVVEAAPTVVSVAETPAAGTVQTGRDTAAQLEHLRSLLRTTDEKITALTAARRTITKKLKAMGELVVEDPWTPKRLMEKIEEIQMEIGNCCVDYWSVEEEEKLEAGNICIGRMEDAIRKGCQFNGEGYIDTDGTWIVFEEDI